MARYRNEELLRELHQQTSVILNKVREWQTDDPVSILQQPAPGKWSAIQCLEHLNSYSRFYLPAIENSMYEFNGAGSANNYFTSGLIGGIFYRLMLPGKKGGIKMRSPKNHRPSALPDSIAVMHEFIHHQQSLLRILENAKTADLGRIHVPISLSRFIRLKLGDVFLFYTAHILRHMLQAERARNKCRAGENSFDLKPAGS